MNKIVLTFGLLSVFIFSCKKDITSDTIIYHELDLPIKITSVDSLIQDPSCGHILSPSYNTVSSSLDINNDGVVDFTLTCKTWHYLLSMSYPCANYNNSIIISGTSESNTVSVSQAYSTKLKSFNFNEIIGTHPNWNKDARLMYYSPQYDSYYDFNGSVYIGLKVGDDFGWLYLNKDTYLITIMSYAINQTDNNSIRAGQRI